MSEKNDLQGPAFGRSGDASVVTRDKFPAKSMRPEAAYLDALKSPMPVEGQVAGFHH